MISLKISLFHEVIVYFEKIPHKNRSETSWFMGMLQCFFFKLYDITGKVTQNWGNKQTLFFSALKRNSAI